MSRACKCDLCGAFYVPKKGAWRYGLLEYDRVVIDVCHECSFKLDEFVREIKENNNAEN